MLFAMMNRSDILKQLALLGLDGPEAIIFYELSRSSLSRLELSRVTGINRSKVYRIADSLLARGIIESISDDKGQKLAAASMKSLEQILTDAQTRLEQQRQALTKLQEFATNPTEEIEVGVRTFKGEEGLRRQLWGEIRDRSSEIVIFSKGESLNIPFGRHFSKKFRGAVVERDIHQRALQNVAEEQDEYETPGYQKHFSVRVVPKSVLRIDREISVLKGRVNIYSWRDGAFFGIEIQDRSFARLMRELFERVWKEHEKQK